MFLHRCQFGGFLFPLLLAQRRFARCLRQHHDPTPLRPPVQLLAQVVGYFRPRRPGNRNRSIDPAAPSNFTSDTYSSKCARSRASRRSPQAQRHRQRCAAAAATAPRLVHRLHHQALRSDRRKPRAEEHRRSRRTRGRRRSSAGLSTVHSPLARRFVEGARGHARPGTAHSSPAARRETCPAPPSAFMISSGGGRSAT